MTGDVKPQVGTVHVRILFDLARRRGMSSSALLHGLGITEEDLHGKGAPRRQSWDHYVEIWDRVCEYVGGLEHCVEFGEGVPSAFPEGVAIVQALVSPRQLHRFVNLVMNPVLFPMSTFAISEETESTLLLTIDLRPGYKPCAPLFYASAGTARVAPTVIGFPRALVEPQELSGTRGVYLIHLPPSRTLLARAKRRATAAFRDEALREMERDKRELTESFERMKQMVDDLEAREAALAREVEARTHLQASLTKVLDSVSNAAFLVRNGSVEGANGTGATALARDGDRLSAEILDVAARGGADGFDVARTSTTGELLVIRKGLGDEISRRIERASSRWGLTPRQSEVLRGLVDGLNNGEIAHRLGCTARTVEVHVTSLLDRADATSRLQLVAAFWGDVS